VIGNAPVGALSENLREACFAALRLSRDACRAFALENTWDKSALQFLEHANLVCTEAFEPRERLHPQAELRPAARQPLVIGTPGVSALGGGASRSQ
jgi:hypothetical protein